MTGSHECMIMNEMLVGSKRKESAYGKDENVAERTLYGLPTYPARGIRCRCNLKRGPKWTAYISR